MGVRLILLAHMEKQHRTIPTTNPFQHYIFRHSRPYRELILILGIILGEHGTPNNKEHSSQTILVRFDILMGSDVILSANQTPPYVPQAIYYPTLPTYPGPPYFPSYPAAFVQTQKDI